MLERAINFLLEHGYHLRAQESLFDNFFFYQTGAHRKEAEAFWTAQLQNVQTLSPFPVLPHPTHKTVLECMEELHVHDNLFSGSRKQTAAIFWMAWAVLVRSYTGTNRVLFGSVVDELPEKNARNHGCARGRAKPLSIVPTRIEVDDAQQASQAINDAEAMYEKLAQFGRVGNHWIRSLGEDGDKCLSLLTALLQIDCEHDSKVSQQNIDSSHFYQGLALYLRCQVHNNGSFRLAARFDSSITRPGQMQRILRQWRNIIEQLSQGEHHHPLRDIQVVSKEDLDDIWRWNATLAEPIQASVHDFISNITKKQPYDPAVCAWDGELNYQQLDTLSTRLAAHLGHLGAGPGTIIPLYFEKSMWTVVSMLGVMKSGAASVAMDSNHPETRLRTILRQIYAQSKIRLLLSSKLNEEKAWKLSPEATIVVTEIEAHKRKETSWRPPPIQPDDLLYVVFTSGSTGTPKGAMISHKNFSSAIQHQSRQSGLTSSTRIFDFASYAFDAAWFNALQPLAAGGCVCVPSETDRNSNLALSINTLRANFVVITPSAARTLKAENVPNLRHIVFAGEKLLRSDVEAWRPSAVVLNCYGTAECTIGNILGEPSPGKNEPSIGTGCATVTWVVRLDGHALAAVGTVGELWLEGPLVGQGYLGDVQKTAEAFVEDPPWLLAGGPSARGRRGRLYRTGDLAYYNTDGSLQFIGRRDDQVKIRGQRVELGEVEANISKLIAPDVQVVAEIITPRESPNPVLIAFISPPGASKLSTDRLRDVGYDLVCGLTDELLQCLPPHMVPSAFIPIARIPVTATGKTDRRQLRQVGQSIDLVELNNENSHRKAPSNELESILAQSWADVLGTSLDRISVDTPFTRLGGDSISAMQVVSRLRAQHGISATVGEFLKNQTIEKIAPCCQHSTDSRADDNDELEQEGSENAWGLSPIQQMFFQVHPSGLNHFNQSFLLRLREVHGAEQVCKAVKAIVARHPMLRARFRCTPNSSWEQYIAEESQESFEFSAHRELTQESMLHLAQRRQESLHIVHGPIFAVDYFVTGDGNINLLLTAHHLVIDLVSWRIIWQDLEQQLREMHLPPVIGTSFRKWTFAQKQLGQDDASRQLPFQLIDKLDFWNVDLLENTHGAVDEHEICLDAATTSLLLDDCNTSLQTEPLDVMIAVFIFSIHEKFPSRPAPAIFVESHGRESLGKASLDVSETVGWFTTLCPVQITLQKDSTLFDAIRFVKDTRRRIVGKGLPHFASQAHSGHFDYAEVLFNYSGIFQQLEGANSIFSRLDADLIQASPASRRLALIEVNGSVIEGKLHLSISLNRHMSHLATLKKCIDDLENNFEMAVSSLVHAARAPTLGDFPLLNVSDKPLDLVMYRGLNNLVTQLAKHGIRQNDIEDIFPCTPLQEGILLGIAKGSATYHIVQIWQCIELSSRNPGCSVDAKRLEDAWRTTFRRHSIFASIFFESAELQSFVQIQLRQAPLRIQHIRTNKDDPAEELANLCKPVFRDQEPPFLLTICQASGSKVACRLDISHALIDAMSFPTLLADVEKAYSLGENLQDGPNFQIAIKEMLTITQEKKLDYWSDFLADVETCEVPILPDSNGNEGHHTDITIAPRLTGQIADFCQKNDITRSTFLQVSWAMVLSQLTSKQTVCFGYLASGRDIAVEQVEAIVGPLINTLVGRVDLNAPWRDILAETGSHLASHLEYQHVSLARLQERLGLRGRQFFNTAMTVRRAIQKQKEHEEGLRLESVSGDNTNEVSKSQQL